jgi:hypothetical protein
VDSRAGLDAVEKIKISCSSPESNHGLPASNPALGAFVETLQNYGTDLTL